MNALYISSFCQRLPLESSLFKRYEAIFNVALKLVIRDCIGLLCDWFGKLVSLFQPIRYKTKNTHHLVAHVLLRFRQFGWFYLGFSLAHKGILFSFDWRLWLHILHWLWFSTFNRKALMALSINSSTKHPRVQMSRREAMNIHLIQWYPGKPLGRCSTSLTAMVEVQSTPRNWIWRWDQSKSICRKRTY